MKQTKRNLIIYIINICLLIGMLCPVAATSSDDGARILSQQLTLSDDLTMRFHISVDAEYLETASVKAVWGDEDVTYKVTELTPNEDGSYLLCVDLAAAQMTEEISLTVSTADAVLTQGTYSIREYSECLLECDYTDATKQMVLQMLNYGAMAQNYFGYNTQSLANKDYEIENTAQIPETAESVTVTGGVDGISFYGATLVFRSKLAVRYYFTSDNIDTFSFTYAGKTCTPVPANGMYYIELGEINPQDLDVLRTLMVTKGEQTLSVGYSPLHYIYRMYNKEDANDSLKELLKALYGYYLEAEDFTGIEEDTAVPIVGYTLTDNWVKNREGDGTIGPEKSYDGDVTTKWNPQASGNYAKEQGIIYTLDGWYDLLDVHCTFSAADMYFDVYGSSDGITYTSIGAVTAENSDSLYSGNTAVVDAASAKTVKYVKLMFTGRKIANDYVNLFEVAITGNRVSPPIVEASIAGSNTVGNWGLSDNPALSYDADSTTVWKPVAKDYQSGEGIVYALDGAYDLTELELTFEGRQYYFDLYVSKDGVSYSPVAQVTAQNADQYYTGTVCTLQELNTSNVRFLKLVFTGSGADSQISLLDGQNEISMQAYTGEKQVGIFYFLWHGAKTVAGPFDVTKIMQKNPDAAQSADAWLLAGGGAVGTPHWWGESMFGYYRALDQWVVERDVQMLTDAGVDFLGLDYSNGTAYPEQVLNLLKILDKYYDQGYDVPQLTFITKADSGAMVMGLYENFYLKYPEYSHLWYRCDGKPLMVGVKSSTAVSDDCREYFTWRHPQWPRESYTDNAFPWVDFDEDGDGHQTVYTWDDGSTIMSVSVAQHSGTLAFSSSALYGDTTNHTRSWHNGANDPAEDAYLYGYNFAEQFENAIAQDVDIVFVTGWNEWIATRQASGSWNDMTGNPNTDPVILVDNCDINNSRDIQPMKGGYGDNYYMQMIDYVRTYKGQQQSCSLSGQQYDIAWNYQDYTGEIEDRGFKGYGTLYYSDTTGRNDFSQLKMAHDAQMLYAYARTADDITGIGQEHCMTLFLNTGSDINWCGYDYVIGRTAAGSTVSVEKRTETGWQNIGTAEYLLKGNQYQVMIPLSMLGLSLQQKLELEFKWADNYQGEDDVYSFYLNGDAAPYGRQNYLYAADTVASDPMQICLQEIKALGVQIVDERMEIAAVITDSEVSENWAVTREGVYGCGPELSYDGRFDTKWNPQAKDYKTGESIIYTLDSTYDLTGVQLQFSARKQYFDISVSSNGQTYTTIAQVTADSDVYDSSYVCTLSDLIAWNVKYIKLTFTGSSDNGLWVNFYEITATGKKCDD